MANLGRHMTSTLWKLLSIVDLILLSIAKNKKIKIKEKNKGMK